MMGITKGPMEPWAPDDNYLTHDAAYFDYEECDDLLVHPDRKSTNDLIKISEDEKILDNIDIISPYIENNN